MQQSSRIPPDQWNSRAGSHRARHGAPEPHAAHGTRDAAPAGPHRGKAHPQAPGAWVGPGGAGRAGRRASPTGACRTRSGAFSVLTDTPCTSRITSVASTSGRTAPACCAFDEQALGGLAHRHPAGRDQLGLDADRLDQRVRQAALGRSRITRPARAASALKASLGRTRSPASASPFPAHRAHLAAEHGRLQVESGWGSAGRGCRCPPRRAGRCPRAARRRPARRTRPWPR